jgi:signal transduction histidine kinase
MARKSDSNAVRETKESLLETIAYTQSIVDTVREPLLILDCDLRVVTASRQFYQTFHVTADETLGQFIYDLGNKQWDIPALRALLEEILPEHSKFDDFEVAHEFPDIGLKVMLLNARKLWRSENSMEHVLLAIEDITERKRLTDALIRSNEDLQRFAYVAAHDLRSPLNSGLSLLQLFQRRWKENSEVFQDEDGKMLDLAMESFKRLGGLMEDILSYSAAENAPQQHNHISLEEPLNIALQNLRHHIDTAGARVIVEPMPVVRTDRTQMVMVFQNLIGNAIKYRGTDPPEIHVNAVQNHDVWRISIRDNGSGFEERYATQIFEPFRRLRGGDIPGSGIGLATCKRVVERLGGTIWATSAPGIGSTFHFTVSV